MTQAIIISPGIKKPTVDQMVAAWLHAKSSLSHSQMTLDAYTESTSTM